MLGHRLLRWWQFSTLALAFKIFVALVMTSAAIGATDIKIAVICALIAAVTSIAVWRHVSHAHGACPVTTAKLQKP